jgi:hypothetical protein
LRFSAPGVDYVTKSNPINILNLCYICSAKLKSACLFSQKAWKSFKI